MLQLHLIISFKDHYNQVMVETVVLLLILAELFEEHINCPFKMDLIHL